MFSMLNFCQTFISRYYITFILRNFFSTFLDSVLDFDVSKRYLLRKPSDQP